MPQGIVSPNEIKRMFSPSPVAGASAQLRSKPVKIYSPAEIKKITPQKPKKLNLIERLVEEFKAQQDMKFGTKTPSGARDIKTSTPYKMADVATQPAQWFSKTFLYNPETKRPFPYSYGWEIADISKMPEGPEKNKRLADVISSAGLGLLGSIRTVKPSGGLLSIKDSATILKVKPNATKAQVKIAYNKLIKKSHPDVGGDPKMFKIIQNAYESFQKHFQKVKVEPLTPKLLGEGTKPPVEKVAPAERGLVETLAPKQVKLPKISPGIPISPKQAITMAKRLPVTPKVQPPSKGGVGEIYYRGEPRGAKLQAEERVGGVYLTKSKDYAKTFAGKKGVINEYTADIKKPFDITEQVTRQPERELLIEAPQNFPNEIADIKKQGYDAITYKDQVLVLDPSKAKVAQPPLGDLEPLTKEARKYKSADDFYNAINQASDKKLRELGFTPGLAGVDSPKGAEDLYGFYNQAKGVKPEPVQPKAQKITKTKTPEVKMDLVREALDSGDVEGAKSLYEQTDKSIAFKKLTEEVEGFQKSMGKGFDEVKEKFGDYDQQVKEHLKIMRIAGEKKGEGGLLYREAIPGKIGRMSSDELADVAGMDHQEYMDWLQEEAGVGGDVSQKLKPIVIQRIRAQHKQISQWFEKLDPKYYSIIRGETPRPKGKVPSYKRWKEQEIPAYVGAKATEVTKARQMKKIADESKKTIKKEFDEWQKAIRSETISPKQQLDKAVKSVKDATDQGIKDRLDKEVERIFAPDFRSPEFVLDRFGLKDKIYTPLKKGQEKVSKELSGYTERANKWWNTIGKTNRQRKIADKKIFRWLDGESVNLSKTELGVAMHIKNYLAKWADRLELPEDKRISNYITHIFDPDFLGLKAIFPPELARILDYVTPNKEFNPFLEKRTGAKGYKQSVFDALDAYVYRGARKLYLDKPLGNAAKYVDVLPPQASKYVDSLLKNFKGRPSVFEKWLDRNFIDALPPKVRNLIGNRPSKKLVNMATTQIYRGTLGFNLGSATKNLTQGVSTFAEIGAKYTTIGYSQLLARGIDELKKNDVLDDMLVAEHKNTSFRSNLRKMDKALFFFFDTTEKINRGSAYYGSKQLFLDKASEARPGDVILGERLNEKTLLSEELIEEHAVKYAKANVRKTQFEYGKLGTPLALQTPIGKLAFTLATYPLKQFEFIGGMAKRKEWAKIGRYIAGSLAMVLLVGEYLGIDTEDALFRNVMPQLGIIPKAAKDIFTGPEYKKEKVAKNLLNILTIPGYSAWKKIRSAVKGESRTAPSKTYPKGQQRFKIETTKDIVKTLLSGEWSTSGAEEYLIDIGIKKEKLTFDDLLYILTGTRGDTSK